MRLAKSLVHAFGRTYCKEICRREYESQRMVGRIGERPIEYRFMFEQLTNLKVRTVLDVGTGTTAVPSLLSQCGFFATAIDNVRDYWPSGMFNRHFYVIDDDITRPRLNQQFDLITCISVLEHIPKHDAAVSSMVRLLNPGGHLVLTFPYNENRYIDNVYKLPGAGYGQNAPYICQVYSRAQIDNWAKANRVTAVRQEYWQCFSGEFWTFGESLRPPRQVEKDDRHQLTCLLLRRDPPDTAA